jgi:hypothetical protein
MNKLKRDSKTTALLVIDLQHGIVGLQTQRTRHSPSWKKQLAQPGQCTVSARVVRDPDGRTAYTDRDDRPKAAVRQRTMASSTLRCCHARYLLEALVQRGELR